MKKTLIAGAALAALLVYLVFSGVILLNNPGQEHYPVRGVDVSHWQGEIDWNVLSAQEIDFAFIKATEGSSFVDERFHENWMQARETGLRTGAYHFFSFDSAGSTQAENFIANVQAFEGMLPPVIDVEFYGDKKKNPPDAEAVRAELADMIAGLEAHYGTVPILYCTRSAYEMYLEGYFPECDIWMRSVIGPPKMEGWAFWQYTDRERLAGYSGEEKFIDMNVFRGSLEEFEMYGR